MEENSIFEIKKGSVQQIMAQVRSGEGLDLSESKKREIRDYVKKWNPKSTRPTRDRKEIL